VKTQKKREREASKDRATIKADWAERGRVKMMLTVLSSSKNRFSSITR
jgi:hypothetical protein